MSTGCRFIIKFFIVAFIEGIVQNEVLSLKSGKYQMLGVSPVSIRGYLISAILIWGFQLSFFSRTKKHPCRIKRGRPQGLSLLTGTGSPLPADAQSFNSKADNMP